MGGPRGGDSHRRTVIACSGGADSSALVIALAAGLGVRARDVLVVGHVVHDLRSRGEALADRDAVRALAERLGLEFVEREVRVRGEWGGNLEALARRARYAALGEMAREAGCGFVATAHHADDQMESVLMALVRGAGLRGLAGIRVKRGLGVGGTEAPPPQPASVARGKVAEIASGPASPVARGGSTEVAEPTSVARDRGTEVAWGGASSVALGGSTEVAAPTSVARGGRMCLIRPALGETRGWCRGMCARAGWAWREDATNADESRLRAAIRARVVPTLEALRPGASVRAASAARAVRGAARAEAARVRGALALARREGEGGVWFEWTRGAMRGMAAAEVGALVRGGVRAVSGGRGMDRVGLRGVSAVVRCVRGGGTERKEFEIGGARVRVMARRVVVEGREDGVG